MLDQPGRRMQALPLWAVLQVHMLLISGYSVIGALAPVISLQDKYETYLHRNNLIPLAII